jgi:hypothetical protein
MTLSVGAAQKVTNDHRLAHTRLPGEQHVPFASKQLVEEVFVFDCVACWDQDIEIWYICIILVFSNQF